MLKARSEALQAAEEEKELVLAEAAGQAASAPGGGAACVNSCVRGGDGSRPWAQSATTPRSIRLKQSSTSNAHR